jgi:two-component system phosphate regulon sensor histidine kinase PhoR
MSGALERLTGVIERLIGGDTGVRAELDDASPQVKALARAVNALADEVARSRSDQERLAALNATARRIGVRIRRQESVGAALDDAAAGLGEMLLADRVLIGYIDPDGRSATRSWAAPDSLTRDLVAALDDAWARVHLAEPRQVTQLPGTCDPAIPADVTAALRRSGAGPVLMIPFEAGTELSGLAVVVRACDADSWSAPEIEAAQSVAAGLGRSLQQVQLYERERDLVVQLRELDQTKTQFMWTVSHELRTPLASIVGYLESLRDGDAGPLREPQDRMLAVIQRNADRLRSMIENLLQMSRIEAGVLVPHLETVDIGELIGNSVQVVGPAAARAGVAVQIHLGDRLHASVDRDQIDRVLCNLLSNAVKFTPTGGRVEIGADRRDDEVTITVADTGIGVPQADQAQLFSRFFRASNAVSRVIPGTGLGLAIAQTIVAKHRGRMDLTSVEGVGTTVTVHLPCRSDNDE